MKKLSLLAIVSLIFLILIVGCIKQVTTPQKETKQQDWQITLEEAKELFGEAYQNNGHSRLGAGNNTWSGSKDCE